MGNDVSHRHTAKGHSFRGGQLAKHKTKQITTQSHPEQLMQGPAVSPNRATSSVIQIYPKMANPHVGRPGVMLDTYLAENIDKKTLHVQA